MLDNIKLSNILFLDIETVPAYKDFGELPENLQKNFEDKTLYQRKDSAVTPEEFYRTHGGIWAEFGKIICISAGFITEKNDKTEFRIKSFYGDSEKNILEDFKKLMDTFYTGSGKFLCAHNGKEFDYPYIARRMIVHGLELPENLRLFGKKPWEVPHLDTMELWKFGDYKHYTSLSLLASILRIPSPKNDLDGSMVSRVYYEDGDLERIVKYCEKDTLTVAQILLRYFNRDIIPEENIIRV